MSAPGEEALADPVPLLRCTIAGSPFAVPVALVERVLRWPLEEPSGYVPWGGAPPTASMAAVAGWIGVLAMGSLELPVLDARVRYDQEVTGETHGTRALLLSVAGRVVALVVDDVLAVITANAARMQPYQASHRTRGTQASSAVSRCGSSPATDAWPVLATFEMVAGDVDSAVQVLDVARLLSTAECDALDTHAADPGRAAEVC